MNREERDVCERFEQSIDIVADIVEFRFSDGTVKRAKRGLYMRDIEENLRKMLIDQMANEKKQEPCEDAISRQSVNELVDELARAISDERCCISRGRSTATIMRDILHLPPVTPQPKIWHWIEHIHNGMHYIECPKCSSWFLRMYLTRNSYCPNCGAKMYEIPTGAEGSEE